MMEQTHILKVEQDYFDAITSGVKPFEVRRDDRGFQKGDKLILCKYGTERHKGIGHKTGFMDKDGNVVSSYPQTNEGAWIEKTVTYVLTGGQFGIEPGYVVLGMFDHGTWQAQQK